MSTGAALLIGVGALAAVFYFTKQQEAQTAVAAQKIVDSKNKAQLGASDLGGAVLVGVATYVGGPAAGGAAAKATGFRL